MPKANLRVLKSPDGPFHKGECSACGEKFAVSPRGPDFKREMLDLFDSHLQARHPRQWEAQLRKTLNRLQPNLVNAQIGKVPLRG